MLLQLCASFGHLHASDLTTPIAAVQSASCQGLPVSCGDQGLPGLPSDDCPICAAMHIAAGGFVPAPPAIGIPTEFIQVGHQAFIAPLALAIERHFLFQTRAPPIV